MEYNLNQLIAQPGDTGLEAAQKSAVDILTLLFIALGLAMDAFAVAIGVGILFKKPTFQQTFRLSFHFGLFQFLMPIIGWFAGCTVKEIIQNYDHWIAFGLLGFVGGKMIFEAICQGREEHTCDPTRGMHLIVLSVATSIDALAIGFSLAVLKIGIWFPSVIIGIVAFLITAMGVHIGKKAGCIFGRRVSVVGGLILIGIGIKILVEHLA